MASVKTTVIIERGNHLLIADFRRNMLLKGNHGLHPTAQAFSLYYRDGEFPVKLHPGGVGGSLRATFDDGLAFAIELDEEEAHRLHDAQTAYHAAER